jgi:hypothetical protein
MMLISYRIVLLHDSKVGRILLEALAGKLKPCLLQRAKFVNLVWTEASIDELAPASPKGTVAVESKRVVGASLRFLVSTRAVVAVTRITS